MTSVKSVVPPERDEFDRIYVDLLPRLYRRALVLTGNRQAAEDALQDAYIKLVSNPQRLVNHPLPYGYAFAAVVSVLRDGWRRKRFEARREDATSVDDHWDGGVAAWEAEHETVRLLACLTPKQAAVVLLVDIDGYTLDQAAEVLGKHRGTIARSRGRALDRLRSVLEKEDLRRSAPDPAHLSSQDSR